MKDLQEKTKSFDEVYVEKDVEAGSLAVLTIGSNARYGKISVKSPKTAAAPQPANPNREGQETIVLDGKNATLTISGNAGYSEGSETIVLKGQTGDAIIGGVGAAGNVIVTNSRGEETVVIEGNGQIVLGDNDSTGQITLKNGKGDSLIYLSAASANITVGGVGENGDIFIKNSNDIDTIRINGESGDIEFFNADFAEEFDICEESIQTARPGSVMILETNGKLAPCGSAYDAKVVGIVAGAGCYKPGIVMDKNGDKNRLPIAMMGKVFCMADAETAPIQVGDMLTTSHKEGHAMKVSDRGKAFGTVIGKALAGLSQGTGLIPVLVNLQ